MSPVLLYKTFVARQVKQVGRGPLPDGSPRMWSPITSTLIMGKHDAVLVDPPLTHGRGDRRFGAIPLMLRFPDASMLATSGSQEPHGGPEPTRIPKTVLEHVFP